MNDYTLLQFFTKYIVIGSPFIEVKHSIFFIWVIFFPTCKISISFSILTNR